MRVRWTDEAKADVRRYQAGLRPFSERAAMRLGDDVTSAARRLARFPESGREVPGWEHLDIRELIVDRFRLQYRLSADGVEIIAFLPFAVPLPEDV